MNFILLRLGVGLVLLSSCGHILDRPSGLEGQVAVTLPPVYQGTTISHTFDLTNPAARPIVVEAVRPSCGCAVSALDIVHPDGRRTSHSPGGEIPAGGTLRIACSIDTQQRRGDLSVTYSLIAGGIEHPLRIDSKVLPIADVLPPEINLGIVQIQSGSSGFAEVLTTAEHPLKVTVESVKQHGVVAWCEAQAPVDGEGRAREWRVYAELLPRGETQDLFVASIPLRIVSRPEKDGPDLQVLRSVGFRARIVGRVFVDPPSLSFGPVTAGQLASKTVQLKSLEGPVSSQPVTLRIESAFDWLSAAEIALDPDVSAPTICVTARVPPDVPPSTAFHGKLLGYADLAIDLFGFVAPARRVKE